MFNLKNIILTGCITMTLGNAPCSVRNYFTPVPVQSPAFDQMFELTFKHFDITNENEDFKLYEVSDQESLEANVAHYMSDIIKNKWFLGNDGPILNEKLEKKFTLEWIKDSVAFLWRTQGFFTPLDSFNPQSDGTSPAEKGLKKFAFWDKSDEKVAAVAVRKLIVKALVAKMFKPFDPYRPLVEVARKMKAIEGMQPQINDMERRIGYLHAAEPVLEDAIKSLQQVVDVRGMGHRRLGASKEYLEMPAIQVARKMKDIEGMQPQINDMERRLGIMQSVEPVLENAIKTLQKVVDVRGMGKK